MKLEVGKRIKRILIGIGIIFIVSIFIFISLDSPQTNFVRNNNDIILFAHRGYVFSAPENTYKSILKAKEKGFVAVEIDISSTSDNRLVLFHDEELERLLKIEGKINEKSLKELKQLNIFWRDSLSKQTVIELDSIFYRFPDLLYYLDIKDPSKKNIDKLSKLIKKYNLEDRAIIAHAKLLPHFYTKLIHPKINIALEGIDSNKYKWIKYIPNRLKPDFYSSFLHKANSNQMDYYKRKNMMNKIIVYGVNEDNYKKAIEDYGLRNLIIDLEK